MPGSRTSSELWVCHLGTIDYRTAVNVQRQLCRRRQDGAIPDLLLTLEHPAVYTRGRRSQAGDLPLGRDWYRARGIDVIDTDRGGQLTYHGPGQLVGYPIMRIDDVLAYLRTMEAAIIAAAEDGGVVAGVRDGLTGVWVGDRKLASIGVHVSRGVTTHGFAVNVENDLTPFSWVVPCGLPEVTMTSLSAERGEHVGVGCFRRHMAHRFCSAHGRRQRLVSPARLGLGPLPPAATRRRASAPTAEAQLAPPPLALRA